MVIIDQVLIIGVSVYGFNVTVLHTKTVHHGFQNRYNCVRGTGSRRQNLVFRLDITVVNTINDILDIAFTWRSQDNLGSSLTRNVLAKTTFITPYTGVINHDGVVDTVFGVVHFAWGVRVNHLNFVTVKNQ